MEIWKAIPGWEGYYEASNLGRIRAIDRVIKDKNGNLKHHKKRIMKETVTYKGYHRVSLTKNCKKVSEQIHKLVALAFIPNPENKPQVNHKNGNKSDNAESNLEWATNDENYNHAVEHNLRPETHRAKPIKQYTLDGKLVAEYVSSYAASKATGFKDSRISDVCRGNRHTAHGYIFKYA